jgi:hypothetical protein
MEVGELGWYLFVACVVATLLQHPASIVRQFVSSSFARRGLMGLAIAIVTSPWANGREVISIRQSLSLYIGWEKWSFGMHGSMSSPSS